MNLSKKGVRMPFPLKKALPNNVSQLNSIKEHALMHQQGDADINTASRVKFQS